MVQIPTCMIYKGSDQIQNALKIISIQSDNQSVSIF